MEKRFSECYRRLGAAEPDLEPRATENIAGMQELIRILIDKGMAYRANDDVYFAVRTDEDYGKLSGRDPDEMRSGTRIEPNEAKRDPLDFALWKGAKPGEPQWDSPWGPGRPGWHIECSAMARRFLGDDFDLHAGGTDLIFPHHENEIAQSESATGTRFARYWLHNGMVNLNGAKMAKSTGNVVGLEEALDAYGGMPLRLLFLRAHYRAPIEFSPELVEEAAEAFRRIERLLERIPETDAEPAEWVLARFEEAMDDDFGTPEAVAVLFDAVREANRLLDEGKDAAPLVAAVREVVTCSAWTATTGAAPTASTRRWCGTWRVVSESRPGARSSRSSTTCSKPGRMPAGSATSPPPTPCATNWRPPASSWRTRPMGRAGYGDRVEGIHAVAAAAEGGRVRVLHVEAGREDRAEIADIARRVTTGGGEVRRVGDVRRLADTTAPQGVVAECRPIPAATLEEVVATSRPAAVMVLDRIVDPHNLGAIVRSTVAAGVTGLVLSDRRAAPLSGAAFKAAAGSLEHARVAIVGSIAEAVAQLSRLGLWTVGLDASGDRSLFGLDLLTEPVAVVVGAEGGGLSRLVGDRLDVVAHIPMAGPPSRSTPRWPPPWPPSRSSACGRRPDAAKPFSRDIPPPGWRNVAREAGWTTFLRVRRVSSVVEQPPCKR
jgi:cysteinyl-tRNA synthetase/tRNA G18 (ribose-2'-O)-methylase SpoU